MLWNCSETDLKLSKTETAFKNCSRTALKVIKDWKCSETALKLSKTETALKNCSGAALKLIKDWNCSETALALLWNCSESDQRLEMLWKCSENALKLLWNCTKTTQKLSWNFLRLNWPRIDDNATKKINYWTFQQKNCSETALIDCSSTQIDSMKQIKINYN